MRPNCTALCFLPLLLFSAPASAKTCTASGHSDCTITCDDGCAVLYEEPNGPCHKICSDDDSIRSSRKRAPTKSFNARDLTAEQIRKFLLAPRSSKVK